MATLRVAISQPRVPSRQAVQLPSHSLVTDLLQVPRTLTNKLSMRSLTAASFHTTSKKKRKKRPRLALTTTI